MGKGSGRAVERKVERHWGKAVKRQWKGSEKGSEKAAERQRKGSGKAVARAAERQ